MSIKFEKLVHSIFRNENSALKINISHFGVLHWQQWQPPASAPGITQSYFENGLFKDTQRENIPSNKTQALPNAVAFVFNALFYQIDTPNSEEISVICSSYNVNKFKGRKPLNQNVIEALLVSNAESIAEIYLLLKHSV